MYRINDTYRRYIDPIHGTYRDSRYVSYHSLNTNIAETVIKLKSHMFHANIEAGIEHVCNIRNRNFQKFPLAFRAGQFVDDTFYCKQFDLYNVETVETITYSLKQFDQR